jgi:tRNA(adenine34) deaminase
MAGTIHQLGPETARVRGMNRRQGTAHCGEATAVVRLKARLVVTTDEDLMRRALEQAQQARAAGEVPVGAIVVLDGEIVGAGFNQPIAAHDPTAHAEIVALRSAAQRVGNYRLTGGTLYVTIEPCIMCVGAIVHARIARLVYGAPEPKAGAIESTQRAHEHPALNHRVEVTGHVLEDPCRAVVQEFFQERRKRS